MGQQHTENKSVIYTRSGPDEYVETDHHGKADGNKHHTIDIQQGIPSMDFVVSDIKTAWSSE